MFQNILRSKTRNRVPSQLFWWNTWHSQVQHCHNTSTRAALWWTHSSLWFANRSANSWDAVAWFLSCKIWKHILWLCFLLNMGISYARTLSLEQAMGEEICHLRFRQGWRDQCCWRCWGQQVAKWLWWLGLGVGEKGMSKSKWLFKILHLYIEGYYSPVFKDTRWELSSLGRNLYCT